MNRDEMLTANQKAVHPPAVPEGQGEESLRDVADRMQEKMNGVSSPPYAIPKPVSISKSQDKRLTTQGVDFVPSGLCKPGELDAYAAASPTPAIERGEERWKPFSDVPPGVSEILAYREDMGVFFASKRSGEQDGEDAWFTDAGDDLTGDLPTYWDFKPAFPHVPTPTPSAGQEEERLLYVVMERLPCPESDFVELETASGRGVGPNVGIDWTAYPVGNERTFYRLGPFVSYWDYSELQRQIADDDRLQCCNGCRHFTGGDVRHHPSCKWYPESLTKMQDDQQSELTRLRGEVERLTTLTSNMGFVAEHADEKITTLTADLGRAREALREARALFSMGIEANCDLTTFRHSTEIHAKADRIFAVIDASLRPAAKDDEGGAK